jgi:hypothetical protein
VRRWRMWMWMGSETRAGRDPSGRPEDDSRHGDGGHSVDERGAKCRGRYDGVPRRTARVTSRQYLDAPGQQRRRGAGSAVMTTECWSRDVGIVSEWVDLEERRRMSAEPRSCINPNLRRLRCATEACHLAAGHCKGSAAIVYCRRSLACLTKRL